MQTGGQMPEQALIEPAPIEERVEDQFLGVLEDPRQRLGGVEPARRQTEVPEQRAPPPPPPRRREPHRGFLSPS